MENLFVNGEQAQKKPPTLGVGGSLPQYADGLCQARRTEPGALAVLQVKKKKNWRADMIINVLREPFLRLSQNRVKFFYDVHARAGFQHSITTCFLSVAFRAQLRNLEHFDFQTLAPALTAQVNCAYACAATSHATTWLV
jgi:hypothetical protein